ncbi:AlpA family transcriptional regulator [Vibrio vulnificus]|nr:AlpA family transcriptional regulator [Vibrio vulnificus]EHH1183873.1 AlpA family transcriptional regulator [Vibrio vulnificus]EHH2485839.1 AlpA family transcriptional regulator [Vibrio vulnificus]EHI9277228.1 AlpA family transcriptional regulator [Vibrio vulnificus]EHK9115981.1 AlpA family transcriptional regulator [Vibrio vulnificus]
MRLIRLKEVCEVTGLSRSCIYKYIDAGKFPRNVPLGGRAVAWVESEVLEWIQDAIAAREPLPRYDSYM